LIAGAIFLKNVHPRPSLVYIAIYYPWRSGICWLVWWQRLSLIHWKCYQLMSPLWDHFWFMCCDWLDGTLTSIPQIVESSINLLSGAFASCFDHVRAILVFVTKFLISFYSFQDGVILHFYFTWSWLLLAFRNSSLIFLQASLSLSKVLNTSLFRGLVVVQTTISIEKYWVQLQSLCLYW